MHICGLSRSALYGNALEFGSQAFYFVSLCILYFALILGTL